MQTEMISEQAVVILYKCHKCAAPVYKDQIDRGEGCSRCGSRQIQYAPPNFHYLFRWLMHNPRNIPRFVKENILKWA